MKIRLLYLEDCPYAQKTLDLLGEVLAEKGIDCEIETIEIKSMEDAKRYRFLGSPTVQIDGLDIEEGRQNDPPAFGCRIYRTEKGYSEIPPKDMIAKAIERAWKKDRKRRVLFICTHNSARSQMAEGILRALYGDRYDVYSAGIQPAGINPYAVRVMAEIGIDISGHRSKSVEEFRGMEFDYVVTVCSDAEKTCPFFPGGKEYIHKGFSDPSEAEGSEEEIMAAFRKVRDEIKCWIEETFGEERDREDDV